jgi:hypothetical protein
MKLFQKIQFLTLAFLFPFTSFCQNYDDVAVKGYYKKDGTYIGEHYRTKANDDFYDNYSTRGNINPYTLKPGWKNKADVLPSYSNYYVKSIDFNKIGKAVIKNNKPLLDALLNEYSASIDDKLLLTGLFYFVNSQYTLALSQYSSLRNITTKSWYLTESDKTIKVLNAILDQQSWEDLKKTGLDTIDYRRKYSQTEFNNIEKKLNEFTDVRNYFFKYGSLFLLQLSNSKYEEARKSLAQSSQYNDGQSISLDDFDYIAPLMKAYDDAKASNSLELSINELLKAHNYLVLNLKKIDDNEVLLKNFFRFLSGTKDHSVYVQEFCDFTTMKILPKIVVFQTVEPFDDSYYTLTTRVKLDNESLFLKYKKTLTENADFIKEGSEFFTKNDLTQTDIKREFYFKSFPSIIIAENNFSDKKGFIIYSIANENSYIEIAKSQLEK